MIPTAQTRPAFPSTFPRPFPSLALFGISAGLAVLFAASRPTLAAADPRFIAGFTAYELPVFPQWSELADLNEDGHLDYVVPTNGGLEIGLGAGDGYFAPPAPLPLGPAPVRFADLNGDGHLDLVITGGGLGVAFGHGDGTFDPPTFTAGPSGIPALELRDLDGDGRLDAFSGSTTDSTLSLWRGYGDGTFDPAATSPLGLEPAQAALGDVNGDGRDDALVQEFGAQLALALGRGDGTFDPAIVFASGGGPGWSVVAADLNGDGFADAVSGPYVYLSHGDGTFAPGVEVAPGALLAAARDLNGDGRLDLVGTAVGPDALQSFVVCVLGNGDGSFQPPLVFDTATDGWVRSLGDIDGDGRPDLIVASLTLGTLAVHLGNGDGTLGRANQHAVGADPSAVAIGDVNGDGKPDLATANASAGSLSVLQGDGTGGFAPYVDYAAPPGVQALGLADLNGDGALDAVTTDPAAGTLSTQLNTGGGAFGPPSSTPAGALPWTLALGDFNGDGRPDAAVANRSGNTVSVLLGDGSGGWGAPVALATPALPVALVAADLDGDGDLDLVTGNRYSAGTGTVSVFLGNGAGVFAPGVEYPAPVQSSSSEMRAVAVGDVTGDGRPDVVVSTRLYTTVLPGGGGGTLLAALPKFRMPHAVATALLDLDHDGRLDLVAASERGTVAWVRSGTGGGMFGPLVGFGAAGVPTSLAAGDLNLDGLPDLAVASRAGNKVSVLLQAGGPVPALAAIVSADAEPGLVRLVWQAAHGDGLVATLSRREGDAAWAALAILTPDGSGRLAYEDRDVQAGAVYDYRLSATGPTGEYVFGEVRVAVPQSARLALAGAWPNPAPGRLVVGFSLPAAGAARLEVLDVSGRRVAAREVGALGAGDHTLALDETASLPSGVYLLKLERAGESRTAKAIKLR